MQSWATWLKAVHVVAVISWMAGLLYLPRIFIYHTKSNIHSGESETFKVMERRLLNAIMNPAIIVVWLTGPAVAYSYGELHSTWLQVKVIFVIALSIFHIYLAKQVSAFASDSNSHSTGFIGC